MLAYKLFRVRKDGTLGPLFIDARLRIKEGVWLKAKAIRKGRPKGFAFRPGWHVCSKKSAPHLSKKGRVWCLVSMDDDGWIVAHHRPLSQGGLWYTAQRIKVVRRLA